MFGPGPTYIFAPALMQILLTFLVMFFMFSKRVTLLRSRKVHLSELATRNSVKSDIGSASSTSDNFMNLFEMPVLFYFLTLALFATKFADQTYLVLLSLYVLCRYIHSYVHCTFNHVMKRFHAFGASVAILLIIFLRFSAQIIGSL
jgi:hypothetical protein